MELRVILSLGADVHNKLLSPLARWFLLTCKQGVSNNSQAGKHAIKFSHV
jgi:hypothetical protein